MLKHLVLFVVTVGACTGLTCSISILPPDDGGGGGNGGGGVSPLPLDQTHARITIREFPQDGEADVAARITDRWGRNVRLRGGQEIAVNGQALLGPDTDSAYRRTIPIAVAYALTVTEPTRGVLTTTALPPPVTEIVVPVPGSIVSLGGFSMTWSEPDPRFNIVITLRQTIFGQTRTREFGPDADSGSRTFTAANLSDFRQGAPLYLTLTRITPTVNVAGFASGTATVERSRTVIVIPGP